MKTIWLFSNIKFLGLYESELLWSFKVKFQFSALVPEIFWVTRLILNDLRL